MKPIKYISFLFVKLDNLSNLQLQKVLLVINLLVFVLLVILNLKRQ
jgi:hypothetical protein